LTELKTASPAIPNLTVPEGTVVFIHHDKIYTKSEAVIEVCSLVGGFWKIADLARMVPLNARNRIYDWIARNRHRWYGAPSCNIQPGAGRGV